MLQDCELYTIIGGRINFSAALINAFSRGVNTILDLGRTLGTSIRMIASGKRC